MEVQADSDVFMVLGLWLHDNRCDRIVVRDFLHDVVHDKLFHSVLDQFNEMVWDASRFLGDWYGVFFHRQMNLYLLAVSCCLANSLKKILVLMLEIYLA